MTPVNIPIILEVDLNYKNNKRNENYIFYHQHAYIDRTVDLMNFILHTFRYSFSKQQMNCKNLIIANFNIEATLFNRYLQQINQTFTESNTNNNHQLQIVGNQQFVEKVLSDPQNVGVCLAGAGVQESVFLNQKQNIRAALTHTKYIAEMCRKHNDANVMILATDCIGEKLAASLVKDYLFSAFDNEQRNMLRIQKMRELDQKYWQK